MLSGKGDSSPYTSAEDISSDSCSSPPSPVKLKPSIIFKSSTYNKTADKRLKKLKQLSIFDSDDESLKDVKLGENSSSKPYSKNYPQKSVVNKGTENFTSAEKHSTNLPLIDKDERKTFQSSVDRPCNSNNKICLKIDIPVCRKDKNDNGLSVYYGSKITIRSGGRETLPNTNVTLETLGLLKAIENNLESMGVQNLKPIQQNVIPMILNGKNDFVACAPTGQGKTLAYLIPIINNIILENERKFSNNIATQRKPRVAILFEDNKTAEKVYHLSNVIAQGLDLHVILAIGSKNLNSDIEKLRNESCDIVIGTIGLFIQFISAKKNSLGKPKEIKTIIFGDFEVFLKNKEWEALITTFRFNMPHDRRTILCCATYDDRACFNFYYIVRHYYWFVTLGEMNQVEGLVRQTFMADKVVNHDKMLIKLIIEKAKNGRCPKTIVFTNSMDKSEWIAGRLRLFKDIPCPFEVRTASLCSAIQVEDRNLIYDAFLRPSEDPTSIDVIVSSDQIFCGVSTPAELVVNYDIPREVSIYLLRVGRTARNGHFREAYTFVASNNIKCLGHEKRQKLFNMIAAAKRTDHAPFPNVLEKFYDEFTPKA